MKNKNIGLYGAILAGLSLLVIAGELLWASWYRVSPLAFGGAFDAYATERLTIDPEALSRMDLVEPTLPKLVQPQAVTAANVVGTETSVNFAMFGERPPAAPAEVAPIPRPPARKAKPHPYRVAMTYVSGEHRYAVIDSKLYRKDASLPYGESVGEIAVGAVRLDSANGERWLEIEGAGE